jgi:hypothetical protein
MSQIAAALVAASVCLYSIFYIGSALRSGAVSMVGNPVLRAAAPGSYWAILGFIATVAVMAAVAFLELLAELKQ